jgi:hypothetical protein
VTLDTYTGTKIRENNLDFFQADFPESMDIKITNKCNMGCPMCHEDSTPRGLHGDIMSESFIDRLHPYTELALGGGNPLSHPDLIPFLEKCQRLQLIPSMTVNAVHFMENIDFLKTLTERKLIYGLGISLTEPNDEFINAVKQFPNAVIHIINGIVSEKQLNLLAYHDLKILILGYKEVRRGKDLYNTDSGKTNIDTKKYVMYGLLPRMVDEGWFEVVSFDNLAIKQLEPQRLMSREKWNEMFMGDDGIDGEVTSASMYVDMVKREFAVNSCSPIRHPLQDNIIDMFNVVRAK